MYSIKTAILCTPAYYIQTAILFTPVCSIKTAILCTSVCVSLISHLVYNCVPLKKSLCMHLFVPLRQPFYVHLCVPLRQTFCYYKCVLHEDSHFVFSCGFHAERYLCTHQNSHKLNVYHRESTRVAQKVMPSIFFSHSRIKIAMWKLRVSNWCLLRTCVQAHLRLTDSAAVVVCENGVCVWHALKTTSCNWILSGGERKCG